MGNEDNQERFVEFANAHDAQKYIDEQGCTAQMDGNCTPTDRPQQLSFAFTNSSALEDARARAVEWFGYAMVGVIILAALIMWITIGRTITDGRRETAVFRAIGFKRIDIVAVYTVYTVILSGLVMLFAGAVGWIGATVMQGAFASELTAQAQYGFGGLDMTKEVQLLAVNQQQLVLIAAACLVTGVLSMILPLLRNVRRNPIRDMREE